jgi:hypothetical protein
MTKKLFTLTAILIALISCNKNNNGNNNGQNTNCKITSITYDFSPSPRTYNATYVGNNLTELVSTVNKTIFTFNSSNQITKRETYDIGNPQVQQKTEYTYNSNGNLTEENNYEYFSGSLNATSKFTYSYSGNKRTEMLIYSNGGTTYDGKYTYTWTGDNITALTNYSNTNTIDCINNFVFDLNKTNSFYSNFPNFYIQDLYDEDLTHVYFLSKNQMTTNSSQCPTLETDNWTYTYNTSNLTKIVKINNGSIPMWTFNYSCD